MPEREYAADLKRAIVSSPRELTDEWHYTSHGIYIELVSFEDCDDGPVRIFPGEEVVYEGTIVLGWIQRLPEREENAARKERLKSTEMLNAAQGLTDIVSALKRREQEGLTVPTILLGMNLRTEEAKFAYTRLGFYYLGTKPGRYPFEDSFDMAAATATFSQNLDQLKNKPIHGKTLFEQLEERSRKQRSS